MPNPPRPAIDHPENDMTAPAKDAARPHSHRMKQPEAAVYCGVFEHSLEKRRVSGRGPIFLKLGRAIVYDSADLDAWLVAARRRSTSDRGGAR
jgi:hypothetical protein